MPTADAPGDPGEDKPAPWRIAAAIVFALVALAFFAAGVFVEVTPAYQLPGFLGHAPSSHPRMLRGVAAILAGLVFTAAAWFAARYRPLEEEDLKGAGPAARQQAEPEPGAAADLPAE